MKTVKIILNSKGEYLTGRFSVMGGWDTTPDWSEGFDYGADEAERMIVENHNRFTICENAPYSEYEVCVGNDESNYGECSREQAVEVANRLQGMIEGQFPGISVRRTEKVGSPTPTRGPDAAIIDEINAWISENWAAAL